MWLITYTMRSQVCGKWEYSHHSTITSKSPFAFHETYSKISDYKGIVYSYRLTELEVQEYINNMEKSNV